MKIAIITDAWHPQVNGVVRTLNNLRASLDRLGHQVLVIHPDLFCCVPCPVYQSIKLALLPGPGIKRMLQRFEPGAIHIATEGPLGLAARGYCLRHKLPFTTSYHTQFPKYLSAYFGMPQSPSFAFLRWFHSPAVRTLVPTDSVRIELETWGFKHLCIWGRGVDLDLFHPQIAPMFNDLPRPIFLNVGRVATEKNLAAFAELDLPGSKVIVGDGPILKKLRRKFPNVRYPGHLPNAQLAKAYSDADVFVFPSRTDTFGNVMLESMACGTPIAAYPVTGPIDLVRPNVTGVLHEDLRTAALQALDRADRNACRRFAESLPWTRVGGEFASYLQKIA